MCQLLSVARELTTYREMLPWMHPLAILKCYMLCKFETANAHAPMVLESFLLDRCALSIHHEMRPCSLSFIISTIVLLGRSPRKNCKNDLDDQTCGNSNDFQLANNTPPLSVIGSVIALSARIHSFAGPVMCKRRLENTACLT